MKIYILYGYDMQNGTWEPKVYKSEEEAETNFYSYAADIGVEYGYIDVKGWDAYWGKGSFHLRLVNI